MRKPILLTPVTVAFVTLMLASCNNDGKVKEKPAADTNTTSTAGKPAAATTANNPRRNVEQCFSNQGLKYETEITLFTEDTLVRGNVTSRELDSNKPEKAKFTGTIRGNQLTISFRGTAPVVGAASEWTTKPWVLEKTAAGEKLLITFKAKNYETNQWEEMVYEFLVCGK